jgi:hypothetical protein
MVALAFAGNRQKVIAPLEMLVQVIINLNL